LVAALKNRHRDPRGGGFLLPQIISQGSEPSASLGFRVVERTRYVLRFLLGGGLWGKCYSL
jgi:hypothetical protein